MNQYILIIFWIGFLAMAGNGAWKIELINGEECYRNTKLFAVIAFLPIFLMATFREFYMDTWVYVSSYYSMPTAFSGVLSYLEKYNDKGFYLVSAVIHILFGNNYLVYLGILAGFQSIAVVRLFRKYSDNFIFAVFLFLASTDYISWMFNGVRQFTAVAVSLFAFPYFVESDIYGKRHWIKGILIILLASTFHKSALLLIPFMLVAKEKCFNKYTWMFMGVAILAVLFVSRFTSLLDTALASTQYHNVVSDYTEWNDNGTNPIRVLVYSIPAIIAWFGRRKIDEQNDPIINFCVNMSVFSAGLYLVSMVTSGIFIGRLPIYCSLYSYILLPWEFDNVFSLDNGKTIKMLAVVGYLLFYIYQMHFINGMF